MLVCENDERDCMARRSDHSRAELKQLVIQATEEIVRNAVEPLTARNIATKIGYTVGTLYNAFKNLDDIILHVNANTLDALYQLLMSAATVDQYSTKQIGLAYVTFSQKETARWQLLFQHRYSEMIAPSWYQEKVDKVFQIPEKSLKEAFPQFNDLMTAKAAKILWSGLHGICMLSLGGKFDYIKAAEPIENLAEAFIDNFLKGLQTGPLMTSLPALTPQVKLFTVLA